MSKSVISNESVVLVSGGARGITAQCVIKLAHKNPCKFILLGRSAIDTIQPDWANDCNDDPELKHRIMNSFISNGQKATPQAIEKKFKEIRSQQEVESTLSAIRQTGSQVEYIDVDVTNSVRVSERLQEPIRRMGPVTGIIHGAGMLADKRIEKKSSEDYDSVISPKVDGLKNLLSVAPVKNLSFLVLFSSIVGVFGNIGQTDYAIANEVLNKAAYQAKRENPNCRVLSINWGPWDSGMVTPELKRAFAERNMEVIPAAAGAELLVNEITAVYKEQDNPVQLVVGAVPTRLAGVISPDLHQYQISRSLTLDANPFLVDHQIGNNPVLPATCAASWVASVCEQLYPGYTFSSIEDYKVLKGIVFDDNLASEHILEISEMEKSTDGLIKFAARIFSFLKNGKPVYHYSLNIKLLKDSRPIPTHILPLEETTGDQKPI
ncbi:MAG TPA: SDR family NAD(P)-dependent oxidoreductase, partial [Leptolinea sp.]